MKDQKVTSHGQNFNELKSRFQSNIYGTPKGKLRLDLIQEDFELYFVPEVAEKKLRVLDVGCGDAIFSMRLANQCHQLTLTDISTDMLDAAAGRAKSEGVSEERLTYHQGPLQEVLPAISSSFDLVIAHAVLEWVDEPAEALALIASKVAPGGWLSLAFYNENGLTYRNLLQGNFKKLKKGDWDQRKGGLTPQNPIPPDLVYDILQEANFEQVCRRGIRTFYDFMQRHVREGRSYEDVLEMERRYSTTEPFLSIARYIHVLYRRPD
ncbi:methyltransferase domain-containing protein [Hahella ganghwensis]|uniref:methyltransferase domain-containing protein n=1 Tax=Hahella ganghwensis TaxID=286420 RepID=UPI000477A435|nr:methyltransferase domain-containing protein [Hahella ganghwensis]